VKLRIGIRLLVNGKHEVVGISHIAMVEDPPKSLHINDTYILVAEREPVARASLSDLLRFEGYHVLEAPDSDAAIDHINKNERLKVILTDLDMPSWHSVIQHAHAVVPDAFVLCMVARVSTYDVRESQRLGAHGHFLKPLEFMELHRSIQNLLKGKP
jgi:DNA-binding NarL/FixJ family response regulator